MMGSTMPTPIEFEPAGATILSPVGARGGVNLEPDVRVVQNLLNRVPHSHGGPYVRLDVDGRCGPRTKKAILEFQVKQVGWSKADGRLDPDGPGFRRLKEAAIRHGSTSFRIARAEVQGSPGEVWAEDTIDRFFVIWNPELPGERELYFFNPEGPTVSLEALVPRLGYREPGSPFTSTRARSPGSFASAMGVHNLRAAPGTGTADLALSLVLASEVVLIRWLHRWTRQVKATGQLHTVRGRLRHVTRLAAPT